MPINTLGCSCRALLLLQVDKISILFALLIFVYLGFCRPHRLAFAAPVLYSGMMAIMVFFYWLAWTQHPS